MSCLNLTVFLVLHDLLLVVTADAETNLKQRAKAFVFFELNGSSEKENFALPTLSLCEHHSETSCSQQYQELNFYFSCFVQ